MRFKEPQERVSTLVLTMNPAVSHGLQPRQQFVGITGYLRLRLGDFTSERRNSRLSLPKQMSAAGPTRKGPELPPARIRDLVDEPMQFFFERESHLALPTSGISYAMVAYLVPRSDRPSSVTPPGAPQVDDRRAPRYHVAVRTFVIIRGGYSSWRVARAEVKDGGIVVALRPHHGQRS